MATGRKEIRRAVGDACGNGLRPRGRAERIVFGTDGQDRAGDLFDGISPRLRYPRPRDKILQPSSFF
jgi:hypothetical protein